MLKKIEKLVHGDKEAEKKDNRSKERASIRGSGMDESSLAHHAKSKNSVQARQALMNLKNDKKIKMQLEISKSQITSLKLKVNTLP